MLIKSRIAIFAFITLISGCASIGATFDGSSEDQKLMLKKYYESESSCKPYKSKVYGGVKLDARLISNPSDLGFFSGMFYLPVAVISIIDMPFSAISDTVLLPYTLYDFERNRGKRVKPSGEICSQNVQVQ